MPTRSDRCRRRVTPRRVCDQCFEATGGVKAYLIGKLYRETKKGHGGDRRSAGASSSQNGDLKTVDLIAEQFNVSDRTRSGENHLHGTPIRDDLPPAP